MIDIRFLPDSDLQDYSEAVKEYEDIWRTDGERIVQIWEKYTGLKFRETYINAIVHESISRSHALSLRSNLDKERKTGVLVHELGHRMLYKRVEGGKDATSLETHKLLFLVLYEVLTELYGEDFAKRAVEWDSNLPRPQYKEAWDWALKFSPEERKEKFKEILNGGYQLLLNGN